MPDVEGLIDKRAHLVVGSLIATSRPPPHLASITAEAARSSHSLIKDRSSGKVHLTQRNETPLSSNHDPHKPSSHETPSKRDSSKD